MKSSTFLLMLLILLSSCKTKEAVTYSSTKLHNDAYEVYPSWEEKYSSSNKYIPLGVGLGSAAYGYLRDPIKYDGKDIGSGLTALAFGIGGYLISAQLTKSLTNGNPKKIKYKPSESHLWVNNYNLRKGSDYKIIGDSYAYPLRIIPFYKEKEFIETEEKLKREKEKRDKEIAHQRAVQKEITQQNQAGDPDKWDKYSHTKEELLGRWAMENGFSEIVLQPNNEAIFVDKYGNRTQTSWSIKNEYDDEASETRQYLYFNCCISKGGLTKFWLKPSPKYTLKLIDSDMYYKNFYKVVEDKHQGITSEQFNKVYDYFVGEWKASVMLAFLKTTQVVELREDGTYFANNSYAGTGNGQWYLYYDNHDGHKFFYITLVTLQESGQFLTQRYAVDAESLGVNSYEMWAIDGQIDEKVKYERIDNIEDYSSSLGGSKVLGAIVIGAIINGVTELQSAQDLRLRHANQRNIDRWIEDHQKYKNPMYKGN